jgi:hypothetical protein
MLTRIEYNPPSPFAGGFLGFLTLLFVAAKLFGYINWSWWTVFLPLWGPLVFVVVLLTVIGIIAFGLAVAEHWRDRRSTVKFERRRGIPWR